MDMRIQDGGMHNNLFERTVIYFIPKTIKKICEKVLKYMESLAKMGA
jgi:hypothetical protein